jgi:hypothetical protein
MEDWEEHVETALIGDTDERLKLELDDSWCLTEELDESDEVSGEEGREEEWFDCRV